MFLERAVLHTREEQTFPVASPEDVVVMKVLAGRPHDLEDIMAIMRARASTIDLEQIEQSLALLEEALGQSDLRRVFSTVTKAARKKKTRSPRRE